MIVHVLHIFWLYFIILYYIILYYTTLYYIYIYTNVYVSMRVSVLHTHIYIYTHSICIWVCAGLSCDRIMMSYPLPVYFEKSSMDCLHPPNCLRHWGKRLQNPPVMNRTLPVAGKWSSNGGRSCRHPPASNIRDIPIFGDLKLQSIAEFQKEIGVSIGGKGFQCWLLTQDSRRNRMWHVKWCDTILVRYIFNIPINSMCD